MDVVRHDHQSRNSKPEECQPPLMRRRYATQPLTKATDPASSGHSHILGRAILTIETHGSETSYFFTFMPNASNEANTMLLQSSFDYKPGHSGGFHPRAELKILEDLEEGDLRKYH
ncbi:hypothetical protein EYZ11_003607 [Aspergillus tanneri]|uniref:Uncharacterized protein n=1 Tax=Aspergillus tanneri TaxID=1220188 RepID=A0A4S3JN78_9EURO|nr:hypothetical protein EYZ11_003607 [Aspergillus tanneri]